VPAVVNRGLVVSHRTFSSNMADVPDYTQNMAQPVSRDGFLYAGEGLYVKPEGATTAIHHRRDARSLHALLTYAPPPPSTEPELTKKGEVAKRPLRTYKDEPVHFYSAQLALYGLKVFKTKDAAKKNLLMAFRGGNTLDVPEHLVQLERELKAEYDQANKVAVDTYYAEKAQREAAQREFEHNRALFDGLDGNDDGLDQQIADLRIGEDDASQTAAVLELLGGLTQAELALLVARLVCDDPSLMVCVEEEVDEIRARRDVDDVAPAPTKQAAMKGNEVRLLPYHLHSTEHRPDLQRPACAGHDEANCSQVHWSKSAAAEADSRGL
jgi:hypothetical protein